MLDGQAVPRAVASCCALLALVLGACGEPDESSPELRVLYQDRVSRQGELEARGLPLLHYVVTQELLRQGVIAGFDSVLEATSFLSQYSASATGVAPCGELSYSRYSKRGDLGGSKLLRLRQGEGVMLLNHWDNDIKSLRVSDCPGFVTLYEQSEFRGKTLTFDSGVQIASLAQFKLSLLKAWEEETSSIRSIAFFDFNSSETGSARMRTVRASVPLQAGQAFQAGTCGLPESSGTGDTFLRLYEPGGREIAANDDQCGALSSLSYTVPAGASGDYELHIGCFGDSTCQGRVAYTYFWKSLDEAPPDVFQGQ
jgi:hypothetical protein